MWCAPGFTSPTSWPGTRSSTGPAPPSMGNLASCPDQGNGSPEVAGQHRHRWRGAFGSGLRPGPPGGGGTARVTAPGQATEQPGPARCLSLRLRLLPGGAHPQPDVSLIQVSGTAAIDEQGRASIPATSGPRSTAPSTRSPRSSARRAPPWPISSRPASLSSAPRTPWSIRSGPQPGAWKPAGRHHGGRHLPGGIAF